MNAWQMKNFYFIIHKNRHSSTRKYIELLIEAREENNHLWSDNKRLSHEVKRQAKEIDKLLAEIKRLEDD